jgi:hypothetical protein
MRSPFCRHVHRAQKLAAAAPPQYPEPSPSPARTNFGGSNQPVVLDFPKVLLAGLLLCVPHGIISVLRAEQPPGVDHANWGESASSSSLV